MSDMLNELNNELKDSKLELDKKLQPSKGDFFDKREYFNIDFDELRKYANEALKNYDINTTVNDLLESRTNPLDSKTNGDNLKNMIENKFDSIGDCFEKFTNEAILRSDNCTSDILSVSVYWDMLSKNTEKSVYNQEKISDILFVDEYRREDRANLIENISMYQELHQPIPEKMISQLDHCNNILGTVTHAYRNLNQSQNQLERERLSISMVQLEEIYPETIPFYKEMYKSMYDLIQNSPFFTAQPDLITGKDINEIIQTSILLDAQSPMEGPLYLKQAFDELLESKITNYERPVFTQDYAEFLVKDVYERFQGSFNSNLHNTYKPSTNELTEQKSAFDNMYRITR